jgi:hypothetical protein
MVVKIGVHTVSCGEIEKIVLIVRENPQSKSYEING